MSSRYRCRIQDWEGEVEAHGPQHAASEAAQAFNKQLPGSESSPIKGFAPHEQELEVSVLPLEVEHPEWTHFLVKARLLIDYTCEEVPE